ncbi:MAG: hypothetical protein JHC33_05630 [Ignisphaera sp.]|nr:hypothetical protein [Ignisphaera sp.]
MTATKRDWLPIIITVGSSLLTGVITGIIAIMSMKGDVRVLAKDVETSGKAVETRFVNLEKELGEIRNLHYRLAAKQTEQEQNLQGVTKLAKVNKTAIKVNTEKLMAVVGTEPIPPVSEVKKKNPQ